MDDSTVKGICSVSAEKERGHKRDDDEKNEDADQDAFHGV